MKYDYVVFKTDDKMQLPQGYTSIAELETLTGLTSNALHKRFARNSIIALDTGYSIERFEKEAAQWKEVTYM